MDKGYYQVTEWLQSYEDSILNSWYQHHKALGIKVGIYEKTIKTKKKNKKRRAVFIEGNRLMGKNRHKAKDDGLVKSDYIHIKGAEFPVVEGL